LVEPASLDQRQRYKVFEEMRGQPRWKSYASTYDALDASDVNIPGYGRLNLKTLQTLRCVVSLSGAAVDEWLARTSLRLTSSNRVIQEIPLLILAREPLVLNFPLWHRTQDAYQVDVTGEIESRDDRANRLLADYLRGQPLSNLRQRYPLLIEAIDAQEAAFDSARRLGTDLSEPAARMWGWIIASGEPSEPVA
jgi:hypothetical protein